MEVLVTHEIGRKKDGTKIVRNFFFNVDKENYLMIAQSYFTKEEKEKAKKSVTKKPKKEIVTFRGLWMLKYLSKNN